MKYKLIIGWLYPELMSTYGDRGNIITLQKRCEWRGIDFGIKRLDLGFKTQDLKKCDLLLMGGAQDKQQQMVSSDLMKKKDALGEMIENNIPGLYVCGAYQFLGKYYKEANGSKIAGLNIFDLYTENPGANYPRLIGNCISKVLNGEIIVGFENHGGRTYLGKQVEPFGKAIKGFGNNGTDKTEGAVYKNSFGTYLHGPILPKNPEFADLFIKLALQKKYNFSVNLSLLDDSLEKKARESILAKLKLQHNFIG